MLCKSAEVGKILQISTKFVTSSASGAEKRLLTGMVSIDHEQGWALDKRSDPSDIPTVVLIIDTSGSMGQSSNRLHYAKQAMVYFTTKAYERKESNPLRISVVGFESVAKVLVPPTMNPEPSMVEKVCSTMVAGGGTDFEKALQAATVVSELHMGLPTVFVFFTDGRDASSLQDKMSVHPKYSDSVLLSTLRGATNLQIHTIAIDDGAPLHFLKWIATLPKRSGEVEQILGEEMPSVVGAVLANIEESVDRNVEVVFENAARAIPITVPLQVCSPPIGTKVAFFINPEEGDFDLYMRIGDEIVWKQRVSFPLEEAAATEEEMRMITSLGVKFFLPCITADAARVISEDNNFEEALKVITAGMNLLANVDAPAVLDASRQMSDLRMQVQSLQLYVRQMSEAGTDAGRDVGAAVSSFTSEALTQFRSQSGAPPLLEREGGRQMSQNARTLSAFN